MDSRKKTFHRLIEDFPVASRDLLKSIPETGGLLSARNTRTLLHITGVPIERLMVQLLPMAGTWAITPISRFDVGAVARAGNESIYFGANVEFAGLALNQSIHAEQAAVINAWHHGAGPIQAIAVSSAPCGHCRQFLFEMDQNENLTIFLPDPGAQTFQVHPISDLLPKAFGPKDLKMSAGLMSPDAEPACLELKSAPADPLITKALEAAENSYAPYTENFAGCAIEAENEMIFSGRYTENAAFNPGLSPLQAAFVCMNQSMLENRFKIRRAVLVEHPTACSQRHASEMVLASLAPDVTLEYHKGRLLRF